MPILINKEISISVWVKLNSTGITANYQNTIVSRGWKLFSVSELGHTER
jgi:hypothetical protein